MFSFSMIAHCSLYMPDDTNVLTRVVGLEKPARDLVDFDAVSTRVNCSKLADHIDKIVNVSV